MHGQNQLGTYDKRRKHLLFALKDPQIDFNNCSRNKHFVFCLQLSAKCMYICMYGLIDWLQSSFISPSVSSRRVKRKINFCCHVDEAFPSAVISVFYILKNPTQIYGAPPIIFKIILRNVKSVSTTAMHQGD